MKTFDLYSFVYRGVLTEESLDRIGRRRRSHFRSEDAQETQRSLSFDFLDSQLLVEAQRMSVVYAAIHAFENTIRSMVIKAMTEKHGATWWDKSQSVFGRLQSPVWRRIQNSVGMGRVVRRR